MVLAPAATRAASEASAVPIAVSCAQLVGRNLLPSTTIRVVRRRLAPTGSEVDRGTEDNSIVFACALPDGAVRSLGTDGVRHRRHLVPTLATEVSVGVSAGDLLTVTKTRSNAIGQVLSRRSTVVNVATGRPLYSYDAFALGGTAAAKSLDAATATVLGANGFLAALIPSYPGDATTSVVAYDSAGHEQVLDTAPTGNIPTSSLTLSGVQVSWVKQGVANSVSIS
jgi:hypothetical protein